MTQTLPDREVLTQPIAHRRYVTATYDVRPAAPHPGETLIFATPDRFSDLPMVPLGHLQEPPTGTPPTPPKPPAPSRAATLEDLMDRTEPVPPPSAYFDLGDVCKPFLGRGSRRAPVSPLAWVLIGAGMTAVFSAAAVGVSALMGVAW